MVFPCLWSLGIRSPKCPWQQMKLAVQWDPCCVPCKNMPDLGTKIFKNPGVIGTGSTKSPNGPLEMVAFIPGPKYSYQGHSTIWRFNICIVSWKMVPHSFRVFLLKLCLWKGILAASAWCNIWHKLYIPWTYSSTSLQSGSLVRHHVVWDSVPMDYPIALVLAEALQARRAIYTQNMYLSL